VPDRPHFLGVIIQFAKKTFAGPANKPLGLPEIMTARIYENQGRLAPQKTSPELYLRLSPFDSIRNAV
jgi:hypothetical protein